MTVALVGFAVLLALLFAGLPIAWGMALVGTAGFALLVGTAPALAMVGQLAYETSLNYGLSVLPLFILMGNLITRSRMSDGLYRASNAFVGHYRGGQAMATIIACGGFAAVCGSSIATAATMAKVAMPPMRTYGYADRLAAGAIAAGGTLGILIPPSVIMVIYGIMTRTDIGKLFVAGILPGIVGILFYMGAVAWTTWRDHAAGPLVFALARRSLDRRGLTAVLVETAKISATMFAVLIGALLFSNFVNVAGLPQALTQFVLGQGGPPMGVLLLILLVDIVLGCVLESLSMLLLTIPIFFPIVQQLGFDPVWFGILVVMVIEISLITPPIGLNVFVLRTVLPEVPTAEVFRGVAPFIVADIRARLSGFEAPWIEAARAKGVDGKAVLDELKSKVKAP